MQNLKPQASLYSWAGQFKSYLVANPEDRFSRDEAQIKTMSDTIVNMGFFGTRGQVTPK